MIKLLRFMKPYRAILVLVVVLGFAQAIANLYLPTLFANIVDKGIIGKDIGYIWRTGGIMLLITFGGTVAAVVGIFYSSQVATGFGKIIRAKLFTHVAQFSLHEFDTVSSSSLITRTTNDTTQVQQVMILVLNMLITAPFTLIAGIILALNQDVGLAWILVVAIPILVASIAILLSKAIPLFRIIQLLLHNTEQRDGLAHKDPDRGHKNGNGHHQNPGESDILEGRQNNPGNQREWGSDQHIQHQDHHLLHLRRIIGGAGNQRGGAYAVELVQRKLCHVGKQLGADDFAKAARHLGRIENADDSSNGSPEGYQQHNAASSPNVAGIAFYNPVIDNIRKQGRQVQVCHGLRKGEHHNKHEYPPIRFHKPQQFDHAYSSPF